MEILLSASQSHLSIPFGLTIIRSSARDTEAGKLKGTRKQENATDRPPGYVSESERPVGSLRPGNSCEHEKERKLKKLATYRHYFVRNKVLCI